MPGNLLVSTRSERSVILDLVAVVDYPPNNTNDSHTFGYGTGTSLVRIFLVLKFTVY